MTSDDWGILGCLLWVSIWGVMAVDHPIWGSITLVMSILFVILVDFEIRRK